MDFPPGEVFFGKYRKWGKCRKFWVNMGKRFKEDFFDQGHQGFELI